MERNLPARFLGLMIAAFALDPLVEAQTFQMLPAWPEANGAVNAMVMDEGNGVLYLGGDFTEVGGVPRSHLAAIDVQTGTLTAWAPSANGGVRCIAVSDNTVWVGGDFTDIAGSGRQRLAAISTGGSLQAWNPGANNTVWCIAADGTRVVVGGAFTITGGAPRDRIAAFDLSTGLITSWDPAASGVVRTIELAGNDALVGGLFMTIGGEARNGVARLDAAGLATTWDPSANGAVLALTSSGTTLFAGGTFLSIGGQTRLGSGQVLLSDASLTSWNSGIQGSVLAVDERGGLVAMGGAFNGHPGFLQDKFAVLDATTGALLPGSPSANGNVSSVLITDDLFLLGGSYTQLDGAPRAHLAAYSICQPQTWFADTDEDGLGDGGSTAIGCTAPVGFVGNDDDCDDSDDQIGAATTWYRDFDGDEYGDHNDSIVACEHPVGYEDDNFDCDDTDATIAVDNACDDGDPYTTNDALLPWPNCGCLGQSVVISANVMLEGPYDPLSGMMNDDLRAAGLIPLTEPYTALGYDPAANSVAGGDVVDPLVLLVTGPDAIVDWVVLEMRQGSSASTLVSTRYVLVQRDGDIVEPDGISPVRFPVGFGNARLAVLHRNHMGIVEGQGPQSNGSYYETTERNMSSPGFETEFGTDTRRQIGGIWVLRAGDTSFNDDVQYLGSGNDRDPMLVQIGGGVPTNTIAGYFAEDVNMDGVVKYVGAGNDRDPVLVTIGGSNPANVRSHVYLHQTP